MSRRLLATTGARGSDRIPCGWHPGRHGHSRDGGAGVVAGPRNHLVVRAGGRGANRAGSRDCRAVYLAGPWRAAADRWGPPASPATVNRTSGLWRDPNIDSWLILAVKCRSTDNSGATRTGHSLPACVVFEALLQRRRRHGPRCAGPSRQPVAPAGDARHRPKEHERRPPESRRRRQAAVLRDLPAPHRQAMKHRILPAA